MTSRSASASPLDTEFTLTHFSVRPRSSSASIRAIVSLAAVCREKKKKERQTLREGQIVSCGAFWGIQIGNIFTKPAVEGDDPRIDE
ncbi:hypothetical protein EYF80_067545 [Liparis tanakae]|uniref:Uncharacterized protein n=1 Tax=Liparis tanakae TaxID=230148 RepID=A0A4Z2E1H9_9TELE|nr:hypothetical protein EYF80_067545 [Liparis tanakae]